MSEPKEELAVRCQRYLAAGPPPQMTDYVPESLTEILLGFGANRAEPPQELLEMGLMIILEPQDFESYPAEVQEYLWQGAGLLAEVLDQHNAMYRLLLRRYHEGILPEAELRSSCETFRITIDEADLRR